MSNRAHAAGRDHSSIESRIQEWNGCVATYQPSALPESPHDVIAASFPSQITGPPEIRVVPDDWRELTAGGSSGR